MSFLLKCAFWLALLYAAMLRGMGPAGTIGGDVPTSVARPVADNAAQVVRSTVEQATKGATTLCMQHATACLSEASRLTALFDTSAAVEPIAGSKRAEMRASGAERKPSIQKETTAIASRREIPTPVTDPRRQKKVWKLTPDT